MWLDPKCRISVDLERFFSPGDLQRRVYRKTNSSGLLAVPSFLDWPSQMPVGGNQAFLCLLLAMKEGGGSKVTGHILVLRCRGQASKDLSPLLPSSFINSFWRFWFIFNIFIFNLLLYYFYYIITVNHCPVFKFSGRCFLYFCQD